MSVEFEKKKKKPQNEEMFREKVALTVDEDMFFCNTSNGIWFVYNVI